MNLDLFKVLFACLAALAATSSWALPPMPFSTMEIQVAAGAMVMRGAIRRSYEKCKINDISPDRCETSLKASSQHLKEIEARIQTVVAKSTTTHADMERWVAACVNDESTLEDIVDCFQLVVERAEGFERGKLVSAP